MQSILAAPAVKPFFFLIEINENESEPNYPTPQQHVCNVVM